MAKSGASAAAVSAPSGTGHVSGMGEAFSLDLNSGQSTYAIRFDLPDGIAKFKPTIKLEYNHGSGDGPFGLGWQLKLREVNRRLDLGTPSEVTQEVFLDGAEELRKRADGSFAPVRDMSFSRYIRVGEGWQIDDKDGRRTIFGRSSNARVADPAHPAHVVTWRIEREEDASGNAIIYGYDLFDGFSYLTSVTYATYTVRLNYEARPAPITNGRAGFLRRITRRCRAITIELTATGEVFRRLSLNYSNAGVSGVSVLAESRLSAHRQGLADVVKSPVRYGYAAFDPDQISLNLIETERGGGNPPSLDDPDTALVALDDLPLPGVLSNRGGALTYWANRGDGTWALPRPLAAATNIRSFPDEGIQFLDMDGTGQPDMLVGLASNPLNGYYRNEGSKGFGEFVAYPRQSRNLPPLETGRVRLGDMNGDGVVDVLHSAGRGLVTYRNAGRAGWADPSIAANPDDVNLADPLTFLADMTGDGMPDLVRVRSGKVSYWPNIGQGRFGAEVIMASSPRLAGLHRAPAELLLFDVDGDGCSDLVRVSSSGIELYMNRSGLGFAAPVIYPVLPPPIPGTVRALDFDGRGRSGLLYSTRQGAGTVYAHFSWSQPNRPYALQSIDNGMGTVSHIEYQPMTEMSLKDRSEGRLWSTTMPFPIWVVSATENVDQIRNRTSRVEYRYHDGHFDSRFRRFMGFGQVDQLEKGDASRDDVLTVYRFLMNQGGALGNTRNHAHLDRMLAHVEIFSLDGSPLQDTPLRREETDYGLQVLETLPDGTDRVFMSVDAARKIYTDRTSDARIEERRFSYDAFGNIVRETMRGHGTRAGAAMTELLVTTDISYATDAAGIKFQISGTVKRDNTNQVVMQTRKLYDGQPFGQLTRGLCSREEHLVQSKTDYTAHYGAMDMGRLGYFTQNDADGTPSVFALVVERTYAANGTVASEKTGGGRRTVNTYDADGLYLVAEDVSGKIGRRIPDPISGKPLELISHSGARVRMQYDAFGRMTHYMVADDTAATATRHMIYDDAATPASMALSYRISATERARTVIYYDGSAKEVQRRVERAPGDVMVSPWLLKNPWDETFREFEPTIDATLAFAIPELLQRPCREICYDGMGRPVATVNYNGGTSRAVYTPFRMSFWSANDETPGHTDFDTPRIEEVDVWNHRILVEDQGSGGAMVRTHYDVGLFGEIRAIRDEVGTVATHTFDRRGNRLRIDHRDAGVRDQWFDSHADVIRTRDANGHDVAVARDTEGRVTSVNLNGAVVESFAYGDTHANADGRLVMATYPGGHQSYSYSPRGFLTQHVTTVGGQDFSLGYGYNDMGRKRSTTYPDGSTITQSHNHNGLVTAIANIITDIRYDARNLPECVKYANGVISTFEYEPGIGHLRHQRSIGPHGAVVEDMAYGYDALMQVVSKVDSAPGGDRTDYTYDPLGQITGADVTRAGGIDALTYQHENGYNLTRLGDTDWQLVYNDPARPDRLTDITEPGQAAVSVNYDANGNMGSVPGKTCTYNFKNQLVSVTRDDGTVITYDYDYRGNRVRREVVAAGHSTVTVYIGRLAEITPTTTTNFVILNGKRVAMIRGGIIRWFHLDQVGSVTGFTDGTGTRIAEIAYLPFGVERKRAGAPPLRIFALHDYDELTGLIYMGNRWYVPEMGRFLTVDALYLHEPERSDDKPVKLRLYIYSGNSPATNVDPDGLSFWSVLGAIVGVVVGIIAAVVIVAAFATGIGFGILAVVGLIAVLTVSYAVAHANQGTAIGEFFRGFMIGVNAGLNATFLTMMGPVGAFLGGFLGTMIFLGAFDSIAGNEVYQGIMGWSNWLMPMSWLVVGVGAIMWILNGLGHLLFWSIPSLWGGGSQFFRIDGFKMDWSTGMLATRGGWVSNLNSIDTAYNMGNFAYVDTNSAGWHLDHEAGHNLNLAVYGSIFHFIGFIHEMGTSAGSGAFSEVLADSNDGGPGMWN